MAIEEWVCGKGACSLRTNTDLLPHILRDFLFFSRKKGFCYFCTSLEDDRKIGEK